MGLKFLTPLKTASGPTVWSPLNSVNSRLVFESDVNVTNSGGKCSQWVDRKSGVTAVQATGANQPAITSAGLNGLQTLTFNGTSCNLVVSGSGALFDAAAPFSIYIVAKVTDVSSNRTPFSGPGTTGFDCWINFSPDPTIADIAFGGGNGGNIFMGPVTSGNLGGFDTSAFHVYKLFYNGAGAFTPSNFGFAIDGTSAIGSTPGSGFGDAFNNELTIGSSPAFGGTYFNFLQGDIAAIYEFTADTRASGSDEDSDMVTYLITKYGSI